jgi:hypothetical protein
MISSHKRNIVNVMRSVSRLSRRVSGGDVNSLPFPFSEVPLLHKVRTASAFCLYGIGKKLLKQFGNPSGTVHPAKTER